MPNPDRPPRLTAKQQAVLALRLHEQRQAGPPIHEPIAILGMGCRFPGGADSPDAFWELLKNGVDVVDEVPASRWRIADYYDPDPSAEGKTYSRWGAFLPEVESFDARFFGLAPREVANMDPQQRLLLEVAWEALENAGIVPGDLERTATGVFVGISTADYARLGFAHGGLRRIDAYYGTGNSFSVAAGRIAFLLGAQGPVFALDTACSSSLVALHEAVNSLRARECGLALVGGVNLMLIPDTTVFFARLQALSPDGRCKAFDASANGYVRGEGAGMVVLKRLSAAIRDGDPILAVIRGTAINHDGPSSGLTVPNGPAQQAVIRSALRDGNVDAAQIGFVEAHGTGTSLGDPIEMHALAAVFGARPADRPLYVGSVKSNMGHLEAAAGIAGLLKAVLALRHGQVPPHLHFREPSPRIEWARLGPLRVPTTLTAWPAFDGPRMAGVSSFGFSGTNAHVVLEEAPPAGASGQAHGVPPVRPAVLLPLSAKSDAALRQQARRWYGHLLAHPDLPLADAAYTAARRRAHYPHRLAVVGASTAALADKLLAFAEGESRDGLAAGVVGPRRSERVVFVFPGQGPEWAGMGRQLYARGGVFRDTVDECEAVVQAAAGWSLLACLEGREGARPLAGVDVIHPLLFAMQVGLARQWQAWGLRPAAVVGQSLGEISALCVAGSLSLPEALRLMVERSLLINQLRGQGRMAMASLSAADAQAVIADLGEPLYVAVYRSHDSVVVAGRPEAVDRFVARTAADGVFCRVVVDDVATHCPVADPIAASLGERAARVTAGPSETAFYSTVTAAALPAEQVNAAYWQRNITEPVRWLEGVQALLADGYEVFLEISPHPTLLGTIEQAARQAGRQVVTAGSTVRQQDEAPALLASLGTLYAAGFVPDWAALYPSGVVAALPTYAWDRERYWIEAGSDLAPRPTGASHGPDALRGQRLPSPLKTVQFAAEFDAGTPAYLTEHRVSGAIVVAGASHVVHLLEAGRAAAPGQALALRNVSFLEPTLLDDDERLSVQAVLEPAGSGFNAQVFSRPGEDAAWTLHATARLEPAAGPGEVQPPPAPAGLPPLDLNAYHAALDAQPYRLTGSFRRLEALWCDPSRAVIGRFRAPASRDEQAGYVLHPGLLDSGFQALGAAAFFDDGRPPLAAGEIFVPIAIEAVHWYGRAAEAVWCRAALRSAADDASGDSNKPLSGDIEFFDEAGGLIARVVGFQARRAAAGRFTGRQRLEQWLYALDWQPRPLGLPSLPTRGQWLILADGGGVGEAVAHELRRRGGYPILVYAANVGSEAEQPANGKPHTFHTPNEPEAFRRLIENVTAAHPDVRGVLHLWSLDAQPDGACDLPAAVGHGVLSALYLAQALAGLPKPPRLWLVTQRAVAPSRKAAEAVTGVWQSPVWGLGRVVMNEMPELRAALIDVHGAAEAPALVDELLAGTGESQMALHGGQRLVARLNQLGRRATEAAPMRVRAEAAYLVTGGYGGLGLAVAEWLAGQGARHLLLVGRRAPAPEAQAVIDRLRGSGVQVTAAQADVAERGQLQAALAALNSMPPLAGVVHAAGTLDDGLLANMDAARLEKVLRAKVYGAWHLHTLTQARPLDFFVLFSSIASIFGSPGQGNHAAASAFLDGLAHYRRGLGLPVLSLNWGPWVGVGAAAGKQSAERVMAAGMAPIEPEWGLALFEHLLSGPAAQAIVMSVDWARWFRALPGMAAAPWLSDWARRHAAANDEGAAAPAAVTAQLAELSRGADRRDYLHGLLTRHIAQVLRLAPDQVEPDTPFGSLGFDSLMALEVKNNLERQFGLVLPVSLVWNYPTVAELAGYLAGELGVSLDEAAPPAQTAAPPEAAAQDDLGDVSENELLDMLGDQLERIKKRL